MTTTEIALRDRLSQLGTVEVRCQRLEFKFSLTRSLVNFKFALPSTAFYCEFIMCLKVCNQFKRVMVLPPSGGERKKLHH